MGACRPGSPCQQLLDGLRNADGIKNFNEAQILVRDCGGYETNCVGIDGFLSCMTGFTEHDVFVYKGVADAATQTLSFTNTSGGTFVVENSPALFVDNDINVTGGTYNSATGCITFTTTSGTSFDVCGFASPSLWSGETGNSVFPISPENTKLGIGTAHPVNALDVVGAISASTHLYAGDVQITEFGNVIKGGDNRIFLPTTDTSSNPNILYGFWGMPDNSHFYWGTDEDLDIYHSGSQGYIDNDTGNLNILSTSLYLGDNTSEVYVKDNLSVTDDLTVNGNTLYVDSENEKVGIGTLQPDASLTLSGKSAGFTILDLNGGVAKFSNGFTRVTFIYGANTSEITPGCQLRFNSGDITQTVTVSSVSNSNEVVLTVTYEGTTSEISGNNLLVDCGVDDLLMRAYNEDYLMFQLSGSSIYSGTTNLLDIFAKSSDINYLINGNSGWSGNTADSLFPISPSNTKVGIGYAHPTTTLGVNGTISATTLFVGGPSDYIHTPKIESDPFGDTLELKAYTLFHNGTNAGFGTNTPSEKLVVAGGDISGNTDIHAGINLYVGNRVGIGTSNPNSNLHIKSSAVAQPIIQLETALDGGGADTFIRFGDSTENYSYALGIDDSSNTFRLAYNGSSYNGAVLGTNDFLTVATNGNFGITNALDVTGNITTTIGSYFSGATNLSNLFVKTSDLNYTTDDFWSGNTSGSVFPISPSNTKIGIGTSTPAQTLEIAGTVSASTIVNVGTNLIVGNNISASGNIIGDIGQFSKIEIDGEVALNTTDGATTGQVFADSQITKINIGKAATVTNVDINSNNTNILGNVTASGNIISGATNLLDIFVQTSDIHPNHGYWSGNTGGSLFPVSPSNTKIGIGTSTPAQTLEIAGTVSASTQLYVGQDLNVGNNLTTTGAIYIGRSDSYISGQTETSGDLSLHCADDIELYAGDDIVLNATEKIKFTQLNATQPSLQIDLNDNAGTAFLQNAGNDTVIAIDDANQRLYFYDIGGEYIVSDGSDLTIAAGDDIKLVAVDKVILDTGGDVEFKDSGTLALTIDVGTATGDAIFEDAGGTEIFRIDGSEDSLLMATNIKIQFADTGEYIVSDGTDLTIVSGAKINLTATDGLVSSGIVDITNVTDSSDATGDTGALRTEGGASIAKKLYVGSDINTNGNIVGDGATDITGVSGITVTGNIVSANEDVYMFSNRGQNQSDATKWYGPNFQGIYNYSWSKDYGTDSGVLTLDEEFINAGLLVPYDCVLTGFFTIGHTNTGTAGYSCGLWYITQSNLASSLNVTSGVAGDATLTLAGTIGTTVNPGNSKNPLTLDKRASMSVSLTAGSMIYPRVGDSAVVTDTTWNVYLKRT